jgi:hypothetical protein
VAVLVVLVPLVAAAEVLLVLLMHHSHLDLVVAEAVAAEMALQEIRVILDRGEDLEILDHPELQVVLVPLVHPETLLRGKRVELQWLETLLHQ